MAVKLGIFSKKTKSGKAGSEEPKAFQPVVADDIYLRRNQFSATAENFINTQPGFVLKGPIIIVFLVLFAAAIYSIFAKVDTKVVTGVTVVGEEYYIQSPVTGTVNSILLRQDEDVKNQQELISIVSEGAIATNENISELQESMDLLKKDYKEVCYALARLKSTADNYGYKDPGFRLDLRNEELRASDEILPLGDAPLLSDAEWKNSEYYHQVSAVAVKLDEMWRGYQRTKDLLAKQEKIYEQDKKLFQKDVITEYQLTSSHQAYTNLAASADNYINNFKIELYSNFQNLIDRKKSFTNTFLQLKTQIDQSLIMTDEVIIDNRICKIMSKYPGVVSDVYVKPFEYVIRGTGLMKIIRNDINISGTLYINDESIGSIKPGQLVNIKLDAYPYQDFGIQTGRVVSVSPESRLIPDYGFVYETKIVFEKMNKKIHLKYGMRGIAEVQTGSKRLIETVFAPISKVFDYLRGVDSQK